MRVTLSAPLINDQICRCASGINEPSFSFFTNTDTFSITFHARHKCSFLYMLSILPFHTLTRETMNILCAIGNTGVTDCVIFLLHNIIYIVMVVTQTARHSQYCSAIIIQIDINTRFVQAHLNVRRLPSIGRCMGGEVVGKLLHTVGCIT